MGSPRTAWYNAETISDMEAVSMEDQFDEYIDSFLMSMGPFGAALSFRRSPSVSGGPGSSVQPVDIGVIRTSLEHLKAMAFILKRQIIEHEQRNGVNIQVPITALNAMNIAPEDWDAFWQQTEE